MSNYESLVNDITQLTNYLILGLKNEYYANTSVKKKIAQFGEWARTLKPVITYKEATLTFEEKKLAAQTILRNNYQELWSILKEEYPAVVILIDEAEALERIEGGLSFLREVFQRLSSEAKYMLVLSGKLNFPERMSEAFSPLPRYFPPSTLTPFTREESSEYIEKTLASVQVTAEEGAKSEIFNTSEGHPYVLVKMCNIVFDQLADQEKKMKNEHVQRAYPKMVLELEKEFFSPMFHPVSPKAKNISFQLAKIGKKRFRFIEAVKATQMDRKHLAPYVQELVRKGCLNKPERATYEFFHQLFIEFLQKKANEFN